MLTPLTADGKLPRQSLTACLKQQCFGADGDKMWLQKKWKKKKKAKQHNLARAANKNYPNMYLFQRSPSPLNLNRAKKEKTKKKIFTPSSSHCPSQPEIICTNKSRMERVLNIWPKAFRGSLLHRFSAKGAEGEESRAVPGESPHTCVGGLGERCYWGQKPHARETADSCYTSTTTSCRRLCPDPKPVLKHNQETCSAKNGWLYLTCLCFSKEQRARVLLG